MKQVITILKNEFDEYEVPTSFVFHNRREVVAEIYYTDDKADAISTCLFEHGDVMFKFRSGTFNKGENA